MARRESAAAGSVAREVRVVAGPGGRLAVHRARGAGELGPVVLVHGFAQNHHSFEVPGRSLPAFLAEAGFDCFFPDLRGVGASRALASPLARAVSDYVDGDLSAIVADILEVTGGKRPFLVGHSLGGLVSCAFAGAHPELVRGVATVSGVYGFGTASRLLAALGAAAVAFSRLASPGRCQVRLDLVGRALASGRTILDAAPDLFVPLRAWAPGAVESELLEEAIRASFEPVSLSLALELLSLARGERQSRVAECLDAFERLEGMPLLVVVSPGDTLVGPADARLAFERAASRDRAIVEVRRENGRGFGHLDILVGREAPVGVWPLLANWLAARA